MTEPPTEPMDRVTLWPGACWGGSAEALSGRAPRARTRIRRRSWTPMTATSPSAPPWRWRSRPHVNGAVAAVSARPTGRPSRRRSPSSSSRAPITGRTPRARTSSSRTWARRLMSSPPRHPRPPPPPGAGPPARRVAPWPPARPQEGSASPHPPSAAHRSRPRSRPPVSTPSLRRPPRSRWRSPTSPTRSP